MKMIEQKSYIIQLTENESQTWLTFYRMVKELAALIESSNLLSDSFSRIIDEMDNIDKKFMDVNQQYIKF